MCVHRLGIPDTDYSATVKMPSSEFQRIVKCAMPVQKYVTLHACTRAKECVQHVV